MKEGKKERNEVKWKGGCVYIDTMSNIYGRTAHDKMFLQKPVYPLYTSMP